MPYAFYDDKSKYPLNDMVLDLVYPVGSIYMTLDNDFDPNELFGGEWEQITGKFILAATPSGEVGDDILSNAEVAAGSSGGEATHTLTSGESGIVSHTHGISGITVKTPKLSHSTATHKHKSDGRSIVFEKSVNPPQANAHYIGIQPSGANSWKVKTAGDFSGGVYGQGVVSNPADHAATNCTVSGEIDNNAPYSATQSHNNMPPFVAANIWKRIS